MVDHDDDDDGSDGFSLGPGDLFEKTEYEPEEYDPEAEFRDPDSDSLTIPEVSTDESDVPKELFRTFWITVIVVNAAVLFVSVGVMVIGFLGWYQDGLVLIVGGLALFGLAYRRYRAFRDSDTEYEPLTDDESADGDAVEADDVNATANDADATETVSNAEAQPTETDSDE